MCTCQSLFHFRDMQFAQCNCVLIADITNVIQICFIKKKLALAHSGYLPCGDVSSVCGVGGD